MREEYLKAFSEVEQIIKLMPESLQKKIPDRFKNIISTEKSQAYIPNIKESFEKCNIMEETKIVLAVIYRDFLCSEEEKKEIKLKDSQKLMKYYTIFFRRSQNRSNGYYRIQREKLLTKII